MATDNPLLPNSFQTPNIYVDDFMALLTSDEYKVLSYMARRIYGFRDKHGRDRIGLAQFTDGITTKEGRVLDRGTGLAKNTVRKCLKALKRFGLVIELAQGDFNHNATEYALQTDPDKVDLGGLEERLNTPKTRDISPNDTVSRGATVAQNDTELYHAVTQNCITPRHSTVAPRDTTITKRNPLETKRNQQHAVAAVSDENQEAVKACANLLKGSFLSAATADIINELIALHSAPVVSMAAREAAKSGANSLRYVEQILDHWKAHGQGCGCRNPKGEKPANVVPGPGNADFEPKPQSYWIEQAIKEQERFNATPYAQDRRASVMHRASVS